MPQPMPIAYAPNAGYMPPYYQQPKEKSGLALTTMVISIVMLCFTLIALIPCVGWLNWVNLLVLAEVQHIIWWISFFRERNQDAKMKRLIALPFFMLAIFVGVIRLIIGGGCF
jgi:hypothetical protein